MSKFKCVNCKNFELKELVPYFNNQKSGICFRCLEKLDENQRSIKVYTHIKSERVNKNNKKCIQCTEEKMECLDICNNHRVCISCLKKGIIFDSTYPDELKKCPKLLKFCLLNCRNCFKETQKEDKVYLITCNFHFYCVSCLHFEANFECLFCKKISERIFDTNNKKLDHISTRNLNFKVLLHDNHIYSYEIFQADQKSLIIDCDQCNQIIKWVQSQIGQGKVEKYKVERYEITRDDPAPNAPRTQAVNNGDHFNQKYINEVPNTYSGQNKNLTPITSYPETQQEQNIRINNIMQDLKSITLKSSHFGNSIEQKTEHNNYMQNYASNYIDQQPLLSPTTYHQYNLYHLSSPNNYEQIDYMNKKNMNTPQPNGSNIIVNKKPQFELDLYQNNQNKIIYPSPNIAQNTSEQTKNSKKLYLQTNTRCLCFADDISSKSYSKVYLERKFCGLHKGKELISIGCKHITCEKGIEDSLIRNLKEFCGRYLYNQSIIYDNQEYSIGCPYPRCFAKYLYSTDYFYKTFELVFNEYQFENDHRKLILLKFGGFHYNMS